MKELEEAASEDIRAEIEKELKNCLKSVAQLIREDAQSYDAAEGGPVTISHCAQVITFTTDILIKCFFSGKSPSHEFLSDVVVPRMKKKRVKA